MSCASTQVPRSADCSTAEIPTDGFLHFAMDSCLLEVRATLAECSPESATGFFADFCVLLAGGFAKGNAVDSCLSSLSTYGQQRTLRVLGAAF